MALDGGVDAQLAWPPIVVAGQHVNGPDLFVPLGMGLEVGDDPQNRGRIGVNLNGLADEGIEDHIDPAIGAYLAETTGSPTPSGLPTRTASSRIKPSTVRC